MDSKRGTNSEGATDSKRVVDSELKKLVEEIEWYKESLLKLYQSDDLSDKEFLIKLRAIKRNVDETAEILKTTPKYSTIAERVLLELDKIKSSITEMAVIAYSPTTTIRSRITPRRKSETSVQTAVSPSSLPFVLLADKKTSFILENFNKRLTRQLETLSDDKKKELKPLEDLILKAQASDEKTRRAALDASIDLLTKANANVNPSATQAMWMKMVLREIAVDCIGTKYFQRFDLATQAAATRKSRVGSTMFDIEKKLKIDSTFKTKSSSDSEGTPLSEDEPETRQRASLTATRPPVPPLNLDVKSNVVDKKTGIEAEIIKIMNNAMSEMQDKVRDSFNQKSLVTYAASTSTTILPAATKRKKMAKDVLGLLEQGEFTTLKTLLKKEPLSRTDLIVAETKFNEMKAAIDKYNDEYQKIKTNDSPLAYPLVQLKHVLNQAILEIQKQNLVIKDLSERSTSSSESRSRRLSQEFLAGKMIVTADVKDKKSLNENGISLPILMTDMKAAGIKADIAKINPNDIAFLTDLLQLNAKEKITTADLIKLRDDFVAPNAKKAIAYKGDNKVDSQQSLLGYINREIEAKNTDPNLNGLPIKLAIIDIATRMRESIPADVMKRYLTVYEAKNKQSAATTQAQPQPIATAAPPTFKK